MEFMEYGDMNWRDSGISVSSTLIESLKEETEPLLARILELTEDGIITCDCNHNVVVFNTGAEKIFGYEGNMIIGKPLSTIISPEAYSIFNAYVNSMRNNDSLVVSRKVNQDLRTTRKDGTEFVFEATISQIRHNPHVFFTIIIRDITKRKWHEEQIRKQHREIVNYRKKLKSKLLAEVTQIARCRTSNRI